MGALALKVFSLILSAVLQEVGSRLIQIFDKYLLKKTAEDLGAATAANEANKGAIETKAKMDAETNRETSDDELLDKLDKGTFGKP